ncbi:protein ANTAGONIST OF LIKE HETEROCHROMATIN PROTEIN 1-like [Temnothorax curvispinosus]|uniref:Protein ANTAGONIST OF LIKE HETEROCHROMATIN PROTEIN 1-like n=1 Tax=Temnothorax curvispinosus TaxID=300111 RepID=A0A6J1PXX0_9HYME|nr:protein ANTAGONIST OF LIKE HETEROCHROMATIN PROTEIN 1-like [Temnothorax curvispinosus]
MDPLNVFLQFVADDGLNMNIVGNIIDNLIQPLPEIDNLIHAQRQEAKTRNAEYFELTIPTYTDDQFREHFRMTRITFEVLLNVVGNHIQNDQLNINIPLNKKLLFTIWLLSKPESFLAVGDRFDIPTSTGYGIFKSIISTLAELMPQYVQWPNAAQQAISSQIFEERSRGIQNVVGAIDGCHIPIKQPVRNANDYFNRKQFHSIILQGVCDHSARFIDVFIGMPGRMHDARVFRNSRLFQMLTDRENPILLQRQHLIGDCAYPLMLNLMTPFRDNGHLPAAHIRYNVRLSSIRSIIERAFGLLKVKFRRLKYLDISDPGFGNTIIAATCMLHNFIIDNGEIEDYNERMNDNDDAPVIDVHEQNEVQDRFGMQEAIEKRNAIVADL